MRSILEEETAIALQHINVKLFLKGDVDLDPVIPIFHSWIQDQVFAELLLDVADYRHVHHGPGIILIGHEADYSIDDADGRQGVRYNRKAPLEGDNESRLTQAARAALLAAQRLAADSRLNGKLNFNGQDIELFVNDRLVAPNNDRTRAALDSDLRKFAERLLGGAQFSLHYQADPRKLFGATIHTEREFTVEDMLRNLAG